MVCQVDQARSMSEKKLVLQERYYYAGRLGILINGKPYEFEVSPFIADRFRVLRQYNKGRALALIRGLEAEDESILGLWMRT